MQVWILKLLSHWVAPYFANSPVKVSRTTYGVRCYFRYLCGPPPSLFLIIVAFEHFALVHVFIFLVTQGSAIFPICTMGGYITWLRSRRKYVVAQRLEFRFPKSLAWIWIISVLERVRMLNSTPDLGLHPHFSFFDLVITF